MASRGFSEDDGGVIVIYLHLHLHRKPILCTIMDDNKGVTIREFRAWLLTYWGSTVETKLALR